jgi:peptide/nickel transport system permease protein
MTTYILRRLMAAVVVVAFVATISFFMIQAAPGDTLVARLQAGGRITPAEIQAKREQLGLDRPVLVQFVEWGSGVLRGDLGNSLIFEQRSVSGRILTAFPKTLHLVLMSVFFSLVIALPIGIISAVKRDTATDFVFRLFAILGLAVPNFFLAILVVLLGGIWFGLAPPAEQPSIFADPVASVRAYLAPSLVLGYVLAGTTMRMTRSAVLDVMRDDYVRTARAKGLAEHVVIIRHVVRNALIPVITLFGNQFAFLLGGSVVVELVFGINGLGKLVFDSINMRDYNQIMGNTLFVGSLVVLVNLIVDISYAWVDPRIRYS